MDITTLVIIAVVVIVLGWLILNYNRLVRLRNRIAAAWSQIDVQLRRRYDLIPNLVETVKGYAGHERETLEAVVAARQQGIDARSIEDQGLAENMITGTLGRLFALQEAYPNLKADKSFRSLQEELTGTEGRIAYSRQFYNEQVLSYSNAIEVFPTNIIAGMFNFEPKPYFEMEEIARQPVRVDFGSSAGADDAD